MRKWQQLIQMARIKIQVGWIQGARKRQLTRNGPSHYCMVGALEESAREIGTTGHAVNVAVRHLSLAIGNNGFPGKYATVMRFNDASHRKKEEVLAMLDRVGGGK